MARSSSSATPAVGLVHAATDARPDKVARQVRVGGFPGADGDPLLTGLPALDGEVAMPDWKEMGEDANVKDFSEEQLTAFYAAAVPVPEAVITTPVPLTDERRYAVPVTEVCPEYSAADLQEWMGEGRLPSSRGSPTRSSSTSAAATGRSSPSRIRWRARSSTRHADAHERPHDPVLQPRLHRS